MERERERERERKDCELVMLQNRKVLSNLKCKSQEHEYQEYTHENNCITIDAAHTLHV